MKKIFTILFFALWIILWEQCADILILRYSEPEPVDFEGVINPNVAFVSISAVGDCTFGTDTFTAGSTSFDSEYKNQSGDAAYFLKNVKPYFELDDLTIVNFEGTLSENGTRSDKQFAFRGLPEYVNILTSSSVEAANIDNNHSMDYGDISFRDTQQILSDNGIVWFEGNNYKICDINGIKVGLIGTNALHSAGTSSFLKRLEKLKSENPDLIIASFHWGEEGAETPNEKQINLAKSAIDNGADLVIGHHPHILQGIEKYKGKYILYSLGNFCFGGHKNPPDKDTMIFNQTFVFEDGKLSDDEFVSIVPCSISSVNNRNNFQPTPLFGEEFHRVRQKIRDLSAPFGGIENVDFTNNIIYEKMIKKRELPVFDIIL